MNFQRPDSEVAYTRHWSDSDTASANCREAGNCKVVVNPGGKRSGVLCPFAMWCKKYKCQGKRIGGKSRSLIPDLTKLIVKTLMNIRETRNRYLTILFKVMTSANTRTKNSPVTSDICQQRVFFWVTVNPSERSLNPWYLWIRPHLEVGFCTYKVNMVYRVGLSSTWLVCAYKRRKQRHMGKWWPRDNEDRDWSAGSKSQRKPGIAGPHQKKDSTLQILEGERPCWHLDFKLLAYRTGRQYVSVVLSCPVCATFSRQLQDATPGPFSPAQSRSELAGMESRKDPGLGGTEWVLGWSL